MKNKLCPFVLLLAAYLCALCGKAFVQGQVSGITKPALPNIRIAFYFPGATAGAQIVAARADLPSTGGTIDARGLEGAQTISQDIWAGTTTPFDLLLGCGTFTMSVAQVVTSYSRVIGLGDCTVINYTPASGVAFTFNYDAADNTHRIGAGLYNLRLACPSGADTSVGVTFGGATGAEGSVLEGVHISQCNIGLLLASNSWNNTISNSYFHFNTTAFQLPSTALGGAENIRFNSTVFSHEAGSTTDILLQSDTMDVYFNNCSFDEATLTQTTGTVHLNGGHHENPGGTNYVMITNSGGSLFVSGAFISQSDATPSQTRLITLSGSTQRSSFSGVSFFSEGTIADAINSAAGQVTVSGTTRFSGFTNELTATSTLVR